MLSLNFYLKSIAKQCLALVSLLCASHSFGQVSFVKGQVDLVRTHDAVTIPGWEPPRFWFTLKGVTQAGNCPKLAFGILFVANDKQALSMVLAAQASGQEIAVAFTDTNHINGFCVASYLTTGNPPPLY